MEARCRCCGQDGLVQNRVRRFGRTGVAIGYIVAGVLAFAAVRDFATSWNELLGASEILLSARVKRVGLPAATVLPLSKWEAIEASDWASLTDTQRLAVDDLRRSLHAESLDSARMITKVECLVRRIPLLLLGAFGAIALTFRRKALLCPSCRTVILPGRVLPTV